MKRIIITLFGCALTLNVALASDPTPADQKWITVVQQMVNEGKNKVSTPSKDRIELLKTWAKKNGYAIEVAENQQGFSATLSKRANDKLVAR